MDESCLSAYVFIALTMFTARIWAGSTSSRSLLCGFTDLLHAKRTRSLIFPIQGTGQETRSFCYVDDFIDGVVLVQDSGEHLGIYHIGTKEEITMSHLAHEVATSLARQVRIVPGTLLEGSVPRRCPDIAKLEKLGYRPSISLAEGVARTADWYWRHMELAPAA